MWEYFVVQQEKKKKQLGTTKESSDKTYEKYLSNIWTMYFHETHFHINKHAR